MKGFRQILLGSDPLKRWLLPLVLFLLIEGLVLLGLFNRVDLALYDACFRIKGVQHPGEQVVVVAIDESSIDRIGPLAWPRSVHGQLLEALAQAKVVGFDMTFISAGEPAEDAAFANAIKKHGRVVLANSFHFEQDAGGELLQVCQMPNEAFLEGVAGIGFVNTPTDADHVVRRMTMVDVNTVQVPIPSLSLAVAMAARDISYEALNLTPGSLTAGTFQIPLDSLNRALPTFYGPSRTFKTISYADILEGKISPSYFKDKIVLVGDTTALGHDVYPTPFNTSNLVKSGTPPMPGVEIHATTLQSILNQSWYREAPPYVNVMLLLLAGLSTPLVVSGQGPWRGLFGALLLVVLGFGIAYLLWHSHWWLEIAAPVVLILLTYGAMTATDFLRAEMGRRRTKAMFSRYVSPDVVEELMRQPDQVSLGGRRQDLTIMFCDIRGFTAYSEGKAPEEVVSRLNEYLTAITHVIFRYGGTLDKYLGDGLMAIFGAPVFLADHIERAIQAAVEIQRVVDELNKRWGDSDAPPLLVGVGINSGSVLVGNVGSPERMDYTVIGEDVNLASRVEGLTKQFGTMIVISERSVRLLPEGNELQDSLRFLGHAGVKGFSEAVGVYTSGPSNIAEN